MLIAYDTSIHGFPCFRYSAVGWTIPAVLVISAIIIDHVDPSSPVRPQYGGDQCWFSSRYGLYIYFLLPMAIVFCLNLASYVIVVIKFSILAYQTRGVRTNHSEKIILSVKLMFAFGLLWVFGLLAAAFRDNVALSCIATFLNGLSGLVLLLVFMCNKSVIRLVSGYVRTVLVSKKSTTGTNSTELRQYGALKSGDGHR